MLRDTKRVSVTKERERNMVTRRGSRTRSASLRGRESRPARSDEASGFAAPRPQDEIFRANSCD